MQCKSSNSWKTLQNHPRLLSLPRRCYFSPFLVNLSIPFFRFFWIFQLLEEETNSSQLMLSSSTVFFRFFWIFQALKEGAIRLFGHLEITSDNTHFLQVMCQFFFRFLSWNSVPQSCFYNAAVLPVGYEDERQMKLTSCTFGLFRWLSSTAKRKCSALNQILKSINT